jgi:SprT protein
MDLTSINALGTCRYIEKENKFIIRLNQELYNKIGEEYLQEVFGHELAHAVTKEHFGRVQTHGKEFKRIARLLNTNGTSKSSILLKHNISIMQNNKKVFYYKCSCNFFHELSTIRHNKILKGVNYACDFCKTRLTFVKQKAQK